MKSAIWRHLTVIRRPILIRLLTVPYMLWQRNFPDFQTLRITQPGRYFKAVMNVLHHILAVVQSDLPLICSLRRTLELNGYFSFSVARNSQEAILYLRGIGIYQDRFHYPLPTVMILDSHNPDSIDLDVLAWLRENSGFAHLPVIILCSERHAPVHFSCMLDSDCFLVDRTKLSELLDALHTLDQAILGAPRESPSFHFAPALTSPRGENHPRP